MVERKRIFRIFLGVSLTVFCLGGLWAELPNEPEDNPLATLSFGSRGIQFRPKVISSAMVLSVSRPDGTVFEQTFEGSSAPYFELSADAMDGSYTYELRSIPELNREPRRETRGEKSGFGLQTRGFGERAKAPRASVQTGYFRVQGGRIVTGGGVEPTDSSDDGFTIQDIVHADDVIIDGSLAVGNDAYSGLAFGFDTIYLMENNLRIFFDDTSTLQNYPRNDWRIVLNDSTDGGGNYFAIEDATAAKFNFVIEAGAPANSLYVDSHGDVGINTSTPYYELHIVDGDSPCVRLDQDGSYGWTPQKWDLCGNESNFFIRDATHASKLPFRIEPNAPTDSIFVKSNGYIGFGTGSPGASVEIEDTGENVILLLDRTDGAKTGFSASGDKCAFGTLSNHPLWMVINGAFQAIFHTNGSLQMMNGAWCTAAGVWQDASSREYKENIQDLSVQEAIKTLDGLNPVKYNYKNEQGEDYVGFIAEDVPDLVASSDRKGMSPMDVVAVLTKVVKEQQKMMQEQQVLIGKLQERISDLEKKDQIKD